jgi:hypothetical protein
MRGDLLVDRRIMPKYILLGCKYVDWIKLT